MHVRTLLASGCLLVSGCDVLNQEKLGKTPPRHAAIVYGRIADMAGVPASGVPVFSFAEPGCPANRGLASGSSRTTTDIHGRYRLVVWISEAFPTGCVRVEAVVRDTVRAAAEVGPVRFAYPPADGVHVDVTLPR